MRSPPAGNLIRMPMSVTVMQVRVVGMPVGQRRVPMSMGMRFARRDIRPMLMLMMFVVIVAMLVFHCFVRVLVVVPLGQM